MNRRDLIRRVLALGAVAPLLPLLPKPTVAPPPVQKLVYTFPPMMFGDWSGGYGRPDVMVVSRQMKQKMNDYFINGNRIEWPDVTPKDAS